MILESGRRSTALGSSSAIPVVEVIVRTSCTKIGHGHVTVGCHLARRGLLLLRLVKSVCTCRCGATPLVVLGCIK